MALIETIDADTKNWILDASDDRAAKAGMVMDLEAAAQHIDWIEENCCLYEGEGAGSPIVLMGWQKSFLVRLFGWRMYDPEWNGWVRRFRKAALWASKKNGKSPFLAALGLDLLINDGEPGNKVYMAAKNGDQAKISQQHAFKMVEQSPSLLEECKLYQNTLEIRHEPSASRQSVLAGNDSRGFKAKEGLNGSVLYDEMHVVDRGLEERVSRAGISRRQPLQISMSTAGDDPSSVGKDRFDYGRDVMNGRRNDLRFLHVEYCVPDGIREADIVKEPVKYGKMANPSWGVIIKASEYLDDLEQSKGKPREMARFMQYRGNLWVGSTNPWLDVLAWKDCGAEITEEELKGRDCYLAVDLARKLDMAAAIFAFPYPEIGEDGVLFWPMLWLPEETAKARDIIFPFMTWARDGHLRLTRGATLDYDFIKRDIRAFAKTVNLLDIFYDPHYANELTQHIVEGETDGTGKVIAEGLGCQRTEFKQTILYLTGPSTELERRINKKMIRHPRNPVLDWQVGHVEVKTDPNQNIRPVKPEPHSGKSVDGILGMVMGLHGVFASQRTMPTVY